MASTQVLGDVRNSTIKRNPVRITDTMTQLRMDLQRVLDLLASEYDEDAGEVGAHCDEVGCVLRARGRDLAREQEVDGAGRGRRPSRDAGLKEVEERVDPRPEGRGRLRAHEAREGGLARVHRVAHQLLVVDGLKHGSYPGDPQHDQAVRDESGGP